MSQDEITIPKPFDAHVHLRTGQMLRKVLPYTSCIFPRAVAMGNLEDDPVDNAKRLVSYREEIRKADPGFKPIMSVMLTSNTTVKTLVAAYEAGARVIKFIPGGASTGGAQGLSLPDLIYKKESLKAAIGMKMIFSCHFELTHSPISKANTDIPMERQEQAAIQYLEELLDVVPGLKIIVEHASSWEMIEFVKEAPDNVAATLTAHHAVLTYEDVCDAQGNIVNGLNYCKPIAKTANDRRAVRQAMISGNPKFFSGSDSAPHTLEKKLRAKPSAGIFMAPIVLPLYCQIFEEEGRLDRIGDFLSVFGPRYYGLSVSEDTITIKKESWDVPTDLDGVPIFMGSQKMRWKVM